MILRIGLLLLIVPPGIILGAYFSELSTVNECIRAQGSYDYLREMCDMNAKHPFISYFSRNPIFVNTAMSLSVVGVILCALGLYKKRAD